MNIEQKSVFLSFAKKPQGALIAYFSRNTNSFEPPE